MKYNFKCAQNNKFYFVSAGADGTNVFGHVCESPRRVYLGPEDVRQKLYSCNLNNLNHHNNEMDSIISAVYGA